MKQTVNRKKVGILHHSQKSLRFYFDQKPFYGHVGDTLEAAMMANGIIIYTQTHAAQRLAGLHSSTSFKGLVYIEKEAKKYVVSPSDILLSEEMSVFSYQEKSVFSSFRRISLAHFFRKHTLSYERTDYFGHLDAVEVSLGSVSHPLIAVAQSQKEFHHTDIHIIGAGLAGLYAASLCAKAGFSVLVTEKKPYIDILPRGDEAYGTIITQLWEDLNDNPLVTFLLGATALPIEKDKDITVLKYSNGVDISQDSEFQSSIKVIKSQKTFIATGLCHLPFIYSGSDLGGNITVDHYIDYYQSYGVRIQENIILYVAHDKAYDVIEQLGLTPCMFSVILDVRREKTQRVKGLLQRGFPVKHHCQIVQRQYKKGESNVSYRDLNNPQIRTPINVACNLLVQSAGFFLDLNLYPHKTENISTSCQKQGRGIPHFKVDLVHSDIFTIGYSNGKKSYLNVITATHEIVSKVLTQIGKKSSDTSIAFHRLSDINLFMDDVPLKSAYSLNDKVYFPHDIAYVGFKDMMICHPNVAQLIKALTDKEQIFDDQASLFLFCWLFLMETQKDQPKAANVFLTQYKEAFASHPLSFLQKEMQSKDIISDTYLPTMPAYPSQYPPLIDTRAMVYSEIHKEKHIRQYDNFISSYVLQDLSAQHICYKIIGPQSLDFIEGFVKVACADLPVGRGKTIEYLLSPSITIRIDLLHLTKDEYLLSYMGTSIAPMKLLFDMAIKQTEFLVAIGDLTEQLSPLNITGPKALEAAAFILQGNFTPKKHHRLDDPQYDVKNFWCRDIDVIAKYSSEYMTDNICLWIPTDVVASIFLSLFENNQFDKNYLVDHNFFYFLDIEFGFIQRLPPVQHKDFTKDAIIIPISSKDRIEKDNILMLDDQSDKPLGVMMQTAYSPFFKKNIALAKIDNIEKNQTIYIYNPTSQAGFKAKIFDLNHRLQKDIMYG